MGEQQKPPFPIPPWRFLVAAFDELAVPGSIAAMNDAIITESNHEFLGPDSDKERWTGKFTADADRGEFSLNLVSAYLPDLPVTITHIERGDNGGVQGSFACVCLTSPPR